MLNERLGGRLISRTMDSDFLSVAEGNLVVMADTQARCPFVADVIARNGGGFVRHRDIQCMADAGHERGTMDREHEFMAGGEHTFGAAREQGRWVSRR